MFVFIVDYPKAFHKPWIQCIVMGASWHARKAKKYLAVWSPKLIVSRSLTKNSLRNDNIPKYLVLTHPTSKRGGKNESTYETWIQLTVCDQPCFWWVLLDVSSCSQISHGEKLAGKERKILYKVLQCSINICPVMWETGHVAGRAAAEMEEVDEETLSGYWSSAKVTLKPICIMCVMLSLALPVPNPWDAPKRPSQSSQSLQKHQPASHAHCLAAWTAGKATGDVSNHCEALTLTGPPLVLAGLFRCCLCILQPGRRVAQHQRPVLHQHGGVMQ